MPFCHGQLILISLSGRVPWRGLPNVAPVVSIKLKCIRPTVVSSEPGGTCTDVRWLKFTIAFHWKQRSLLIVNETYQCLQQVVVSFCCFVRSGLLPYLRQAEQLRSWLWSVSLLEQAVLLMTESLSGLVSCDLHHVPKSDMRLNQHHIYLGIFSYDFFSKATCDRTRIITAKTKWMTQSFDCLHAKMYTHTHTHGQCHFE